MHFLLLFIQLQWVTCYSHNSASRVTCFSYNSASRVTGHKLKP